MHTIFESKRVMVKERDGWEFVERVRGKTAVAVIALTEDGRLILTEQFRKPVDARVIDLPAGLVGDAEGVADPAETAKKELEEETGYTCRSVELLATGPSSPGITSELVSLYRAHDVRNVGEGGGVEGEDITVHTVKPGELRAFAERMEKAGTMIDLKVWGALHFLATSS
jgi:ADP-ribose pyrophosphatase